MRTLRRHVHRQAGANCTDAKLYLWTVFQFFFFIQMGPGPTHPLPNYFWIFGIFLTLQSPLLQSQNHTRVSKGRPVLCYVHKQDICIWFSAGQKGISAARRGETGEKVFLP